MANERSEQDWATIRGLRELADFLEAHPDLPVPCVGNLNSFIDRERLAEVARMASWRKQYVHTWFVLEHVFSGDVQLHINVERSAVCRKVVTGTKTIPARPEQVVEEYDWVCEETSILAGI